MAEPAEGSPTVNPHDLVLRYLRTAFTAVKSAFGPDFPCTGAGHGDMAYGEITYRGMGQLYPALRLGPGDVLCARAGYPLHKKIKKTNGAELAAQVFCWKDGEELAGILGSVCGDG